MSSSGSVRGSKKLSVRLAMSVGTPDAEDCHDLQWHKSALDLEPVIPTRADEKRAILLVAEHGLKIGANLAGGCLRDFILGNHEKLKDYDLFFSGVDIEVLATLPEEIFGNAKILPNEAVKNMREEVKGLVKYHQSCIDIVIVDCQSIRDTVKTFDASLCQVWVEDVGGEVGVFCTYEFLEYVNKKVWYWFQDVPTSDHLNRLVAKYGQYIAKPKSEMKVHFMGLLKNL